MALLHGLGCELNTRIIAEMHNSVYVASCSTSESRGQVKDGIDKHRDGHRRPFAAIGARRNVRSDRTTSNGVHGHARASNQPPPSTRPAVSALPLRFGLPEPGADAQRTAQSNQSASARLLQYSYLFSSLRWVAKPAILVTQNVVGRSMDFA